MNIRQKKTIFFSLMRLQHFLFLHTPYVMKKSFDLLETLDKLMWNVIIHNAIPNECEVCCTSVGSAAITQGKSACFPQGAHDTLCNYRRRKCDFGAS